MRIRGAPEVTFSEPSVFISRNPSKSGGRKLCVGIGVRRSPAPDARFLPLTLDGRKSRGKGSCFQIFHFFYLKFRCTFLIWASGGPLEPPWSPFGSRGLFFLYFGLPWAPLGGTFGRPGMTSGLIWWPLGFTGVTLGAYWALLGPLGASLGGPWRPLGAILVAPDHSLGSLGRSSVRLGCLLVSVLLGLGGSWSWCFLVLGASWSWCFLVLVLLGFGASWSWCFLVLGSFWSWWYLVLVLLGLVRVVLVLSGSRGSFI